MPSSLTINPFSSSIRSILDVCEGLSSVCLDRLVAVTLSEASLRAHNIIASLSVIWQEVPIGILAFLLVGLCTSVMWGGIFNMAVEGLGKYTAIASGIFMTMVFGCAVMVAIQGWVADMTDYMTSYWVVLFSAAYILFYAAIGSKPSKKSE